METLTSDDLLAFVVWELNEILFMFEFILLDDTILSNAATPVSTCHMHCEAFLKSYNMQLDLVPMYKYREQAIKSTDDLWTNRIGFVKVFGQIMRDWPEFPRHRKLVWLFRLNAPLKSCKEGLFDAPLNAVVGSAPLGKGGIKGV
ncbi:hypothetical protein K439DRAFT_1622724 [Ramaria rubella]|nr:hypothetical protein K439DRAFT_1622724 [Ramaria rubella]